MAIGSKSRMPFTAMLCCAGAMAALGIPGLVLADVAVAPPAGTAGPREKHAERRSADTNEEQLQTVIVTAQKRSENMQDVPISISAVSGSDLNAAGVNNLQQLNTLVPSFNVSNVAGGVSYFLRGVGTVSSQVENNVLTYVDGVLIPNQREVGLDLIDVKQISVLKGPQGTLFGRNATGGVIMVTTRDPTNTPALDVRSGEDNYGTWRTDLFAGGPLSDTLKASVTGSYTTQHRGWGHNPIANYDTFRIARQVFLRGKLLYDPSDAVSFRVEADYQHSHGTTDINEVPYPGTVLAFEPTVVGPDNYYNARGDFPNLTTLQSQGISGDLRVDLGFAKLRSITAYSQGWHDWQFDADRTPTPAFNIIDDEQFNNASQELQLLSPDRGRLKWVVGGYYFRNLNANEPITFDFLGPFSPTPTSLGREAVFGAERATSFAGFGQGTLTILSGTDVTAGARYTSETRRLVGTDTGTLNDGSAVAFSNVNTEISFNNWTFRFAIDHKFSKDVMAYVSYDRGFRSGGFNISSLTNPPYRPEHLDSIEAGLKTDLLQNRMRLNVDAYHYNYRNIQLTSFTSITVSQIVNAAAAEMYGFEADLEARVTRQFWVTGNLSLEHSVFTDYPNAVFSVPLGAGAYQLVPGDATGNRTPFSQPVQAALGLNYNLSTRAGNVLLNMTNSYNSDFYFEANNDLRQPAYDYLNLSTTWFVPGTHVSIKLWGTNLLDEHVGAYGTTQTLGKLVSYNNPPRLFGVTIEARF